VEVANQPMKNQIIIPNGRVASRQRAGSFKEAGLTEPAMPILGGGALVLVMPC
jgi:hypothetical protein